MGVAAPPRPPGLHPPAGYAHVVVSDGPLVHVAGQVALDADGRLVGRGDVGIQAERALANLDLALAAAGASFATLASLTIYVAAAVPRPALAALREPLRRRMGNGLPPAVTLVVVHALLDPDWLVEMQAIAAAVAPVGAAP